MTDYTDLKARLTERAAIARGENTGTALGDAIHFEQALAAIAALEAEVARLRGSDALLGEVWAHEINALRHHEPEWSMILNRVRNYFVERDDAEFDARAALTAPTSAC